MGFYTNEVEVLIKTFEKDRYTLNLLNTNTKVTNLYSRII